MRRTPVLVWDHCWGGRPLFGNADTKAFGSGGGGGPGTVWLVAFLELTRKPGCR